MPALNNAGMRQWRKRTIRQITVKQMEKRATYLVRAWRALGRFGVVASRDVNTRIFLWRVLSRLLRVDRYILSRRRARNARCVFPLLEFTTTFSFEQPEHARRWYRWFQEQTTKRQFTCRHQMSAFLLDNYIEVTFFGLLNCTSTHLP